jgi:hypothetical protein
MMEAIDTPEDWLALPSKALGAQMASFEGNLRCPICSELVKAAMTARCGHAFCSACVREWLGRSTDTKFCPTCKANRGLNKETRVTVDELRPCPPLDKAAAEFKAVRAQLLQALTAPPPPPPPAAPAAAAATGKRVRKPKKQFDEEQDEAAAAAVAASGAAAAASKAAAAAAPSRRAVPSAQQQQLDRYWAQEEFLRAVKRCPSYHTVKEAKLRPELSSVGLGTGDGPGSLVWKHKTFLRLAYAERDNVGNGKPARSLHAVVREVEELYRVHHQGGGKGLKGRAVSGERAVATAASQASFKDMVRQVKARMKAQRKAAAAAAEEEEEQGQGEGEGAEGGGEAAAAAAAAAAADVEVGAGADTGAAEWEPCEEEDGEEEVKEPSPAATAVAAAATAAAAATSTAVDEPQPVLPAPAAAVAAAAVAEEEDDDEEEEEVQIVGSTAPSLPRVLVGGQAAGKRAGSSSSRSSSSGGSSSGVKRARMTTQSTLLQGQALSWGCLACTFANVQGSTACAMCATPRPPAATGAEEGRQQQEQQQQQRWPLGASAVQSKGAVVEEIVVEDSCDGFPSPPAEREAGGGAACVNPPVDPQKAPVGEKEEAQAVEKEETGSLKENENGGQGGEEGAEAALAPMGLASPSY